MISEDKKELVYIRKEIRKILQDYFYLDLSNLILEYFEVFRFHPNQFSLLDLPEELWNIKNHFVFDNMFYFLDKENALSRFDLQFFDTILDEYEIYQLISPLSFESFVINIHQIFLLAKQGIILVLHLTNESFQKQWTMHLDAEKKIPVPIEMHLMNDELFIITKSSPVLHVYDKDKGSLKRSWGIYGLEEEETSCYSFCIDSDNCIWFADYYTRIQKFSMDGQHQETIFFNGVINKITSYYNFLIVADVLKLSIYNTENQLWCMWIPFAKIIENLFIYDNELFVIHKKCICRFTAFQFTEESIGYDEK